MQMYSITSFPERMMLHLLICGLGGLLNVKTKNLNRELGKIFLAEIIGNN